MPPKPPPYIVSAPPLSLVVSNEVRMAFRASTTSRLVTSLGGGRKKEGEFTISTANACSSSARSPHNNSRAVGTEHFQGSYGPYNGVDEADGADEAEPSIDVAVHVDE